MSQSNIKSGELQTSTIQLALNVIRFVETLPKSMMTDVMGKQLLRCGTSVGANYRAACRARSMPDFIAKMGIVEEEADEVLYWMNLFKETDHLDRHLAPEIMEKANHIVAMTVSSIRTAKARNSRS